MVFKSILVILGALFFVSCTCSQKVKEAKTEEEKQQQRSYLLGVGLGRSVDPHQGYDEDQILKGFKDGLLAKEGLPSTEELQKFFVEEQQRKFQAQNAEIYRREKESTQFLEEALTKERLTTVGTGVSLKMIKEGQGEPPKVSDDLVVKYKGILPDGKVFEEFSQKFKTIPLLETVPGWRVAINFLKKGAKIKLYLSPQNAYGLKGVDNKVPPMSAVIFDVEVLDINRKQVQKIRL